MIVGSGNYYVAQVKGNQKTLFQEIQRMIVEQVPLDACEQHEVDHGRKTSWYVFLYNARQSYKADEWRGLSRVVHVHRVRENQGKISHANSFYISNRPETDAELFHLGIRGHWGIENRLHWVKDVRFNEDHNRIKSGSGPIAATVFSSMAINIHRQNGFDSLLEGQAHARANVDNFFCHIRT